MKSSPLSNSSYLILSLLLRAFFLSRHLQLFLLTVTPVLLLPLSANCALSCFVNFNRGLRDLSQHGKLVIQGKALALSPKSQEEESRLV